MRMGKVGVGWTGMEDNLFKQLIFIYFGLGWRGPVLILSTVTTVDWDLLESGESNKG